jgi:CheY-like chemotaxis protein
MARILVIDDDDQVRMLLRIMLESAGYQVEEAADGKRALQLYLERPIDLIITDLIMPEKEGLETIRELNRHAPGTKVIAISGGGQIGPRNYLEFASALGAARTFTKPIDREELLNAIRELLGPGAT